VQLLLSLDLPRETASVPLARHLLGSALATVGVDADCREDIQLALTEACANAVRHAEPAVTYQVRIRLDATHCHIAVVDGGAGFDPTALPPGARPGDEAGRGLELIRALADRLDIQKRDPSGTVLTFIKRLRWP
jgi:serine/threonine-protein kinase RsbW